MMFFSCRGFGGELMRPASESTSKYEMVLMGFNMKKM